MQGPAETTNEYGYVAEARAILSGLISQSPDQFLVTTGAVRYGGTPIPVLRIYSKKVDPLAFTLDTPNLGDALSELGSAKASHFFQVIPPTIARKCADAQHDRGTSGYEAITKACLADSRLVPTESLWGGSRHHQFWQIFGPGEWSLRRAGTTTTFALLKPQTVDLRRFASWARQVCDLTPSARRFWAEYAPQFLAPDYPGLKTPDAAAWRF